MSVTAWNGIWQVVVAGACLSFFALAAYTVRGAVRDMVEMFRELREQSRVESPGSRARRAER